MTLTSNFFIKIIIVIIITIKINYVPEVPLAVQLIMLRNCELGGNCEDFFLRCSEKKY